MSAEIVKVQRPLGPNASEAPWLIYDRQKRHIETVSEHCMPQHVRQAMGDSPKAYFKGAWSSIVGWGLSDRVEDQPW